MTWIKGKKCLPGKEKRGTSFKIAKSVRASDRTKNISPCSLPKASFKQEFLCPLMTLLKEPSSLLRNAISHTYKKNRNYGNFLKRERKGKGAQLLGKCHLSSFPSSFAQQQHFSNSLGSFSLSPFFSTKMHQLETAPNFSASNESSTPLPFPLLFRGKFN